MIDYYISQLNRLDITAPIKVKFYSSNSDTNLLDFNKKTLQAINQFFLKKESIKDFEDHFSSICMMYIYSIHSYRTRLQVYCESIQYLYCMENIGVINHYDFSVIYEKLQTFLHYKK